LPQGRLPASAGAGPATLAARPQSPAAGREAPGCPVPRTSAWNSALTHGIRGLGVLPVA